MPPVPIEIQPRTTDTDADDGLVEVVEDLDMLVESTKCSCNAGDDNPY